MIVQMCRNVGAVLTIYNVAYAAPSPFNRTTANNNEAWAAPVDFGILDAEGWTIESFYVDSTVHGTPRRAAARWRPLEKRATECSHQQHRRHDAAEGLAANAV